MTISPWLIYFAGIADQIQIWLAIFFAAFVIALIIFGMFYLSNFGYESERDKLIYKKFFKLLPKIAIPLFLLLMFVPGKDTVYQMQQYIDKVLKDKDGK